MFLYATIKAMDKSAFTIRKQLLTLLSVIILTAATILSPGEVYAQFGSDNLSLEVKAQDIILEVEERQLEPFGVVTLNLESFLIDVNRLNITWKVNGQVIKSGIGERSFQTNLGSAGQTTSIAIDLVDPSGQLIQKFINLRPASVNIIWEAVGSHVPPFYKGKALPGRESSILLHAIPDDNFQGDSIFTWERDFEVIQRSSGYQKDTFFIESGLLEADHDIGVTVTERNSFLSAQGLINVDLVDNDALIYRNPSNSGSKHPDTYARYISNRDRISENQVELVAVPLYFDTTSIENLKYNWRASGQAIDNSSNILNVTANRSGTSRFELEIEHPNKLLQEALTSLNLNF